MSLDHQYSILSFLPVYFKYVHQYNGVTYTMKSLMALNNLEGTVNYKPDKGYFYCSIPYTYVTYCITMIFYITSAQGIYLIYIHKPEGQRPQGTGIYIKQIPSAHVITNIYHLRHSKNLSKPEENYSAG